MSDYRDVHYAGEGGLDLYARDYGAPSENAPVILCMHGLTRNSADFHDLAMHLKDRYRVISADQRGRGQSQWDDEPARYALPVYCQDMVKLLDHLGAGRVILIGTSMGGLMAMIMGVTVRDRLIAAIINDVGPVIEASGLARIASYTGKTKPVTSWNDAAETAKLLNAVAFPDYGAADWMAFAHRLYVEGEDGVPVLAYDPTISRGLEAAAQTQVVPPDLWPMWDGLNGLPMLAIRGGLSDLLSAETLATMAERHAGLQTVTVPDRGHAPMLDEPVAVAAIDAFLSGLS